MISFRYLSSHYILLPGGKIGQWPVIKCDHTGCILDIELHPEGFQERPGLEFHSGMMIPGLIDIAQTEDFNVSDNKLLNRHFSAGTLVIGIPGAKSNYGSSPPFISSSTADSNIPHSCLDRRNANGQIPLFERIKSTPRPTFKMISKNIEWAAAQTEYADTCGALSKGKNPGILLLKNVDIRRGRILNESTLKWLIIPKKPD